MEIFVIIWFMLVGMGVDTEYGPGVVAPVECVGVACSADHDNGPVAQSAVDKPERPAEPDPEPMPDPEPAPDSKPGYGHGDKNHDHSGPPGRNK